MLKEKQLTGCYNENQKHVKESSMILLSLQDIFENKLYSHAFVPFESFRHRGRYPGTDYSRVETEEFKLVFQSAKVKAHFKRRDSTLQKLEQIP